MPIAPTRSASSRYAARLRETIGHVGTGRSTGRTELSVAAFPPRRPGAPSGSLLVTETTRTAGAPEGAEAVTVGSTSTSRCFAGQSWFGLRLTVVEYWNFLVSPDGATVVYLAHQTVDNVFELWSVPIDGGPLVRLNGTLSSVATSTPTSGSAPLETAARFRPIPPY